MIKPWHFILSLGYLGLIALIIEPRVYARLATIRVSIGIVLVSIAVVSGLGAPLVPARTVLSFLGPTAIAIIGWGFASLLTVLALAFIAMMISQLHRSRANRILLFAGSAVILLAITNADLALFSSRYIFIALPFLLIFLAAEIRLSWDLPVRLAAGSGIGLASLASYFH